MKKIFTALSVLAVVATAFAFSPKELNYCVYRKSGGSCPLSVRAESYTITNTTGGDRFVQNEDASGECANAVNSNLCVQQISSTID